MGSELSQIARIGVLRVAINTGNRALVQSQGDVLTGVSPALASRLAETVGARMEVVVYSGAGKVFADAERDIWDVAFMAIDATRAQKVSFTRPYHVIEASYAVHAASELRDVDDVDRPGVRVLTSTGSAYDMYLSANLQHAVLEHSGTPSESFVAFAEGRCDAVAGVRASLKRHFGDDPSYCILPGVLTRVSQAMVLPGGANANIEALDRFVAEAIDEGFVARALDGPAP